MTQSSTVSPGDGSSRSFSVLNVGAGPKSIGKLHESFRGPRWSEIRLDIDASVDPDIIASATDLSALASGSIDAIWSSHNIEHLFAHEVPVALNEFRRVLRPDGFVLMTCPDLSQVAHLLIERGPEFVAYNSPAGPITPIDMLFGHRRSVEAGNGYMAHHIGFTPEAIAEALLAAGFGEVRVMCGSFFDMWALALPGRNQDNLAREFLRETQQRGLLDGSTSPSC